MEATLVECVISWSLRGLHLWNGDSPYLRVLSLSQPGGGVWKYWQGVLFILMSLERSPVGTHQMPYWLFKCGSISGPVCKWLPSHPPPLLTPWDPSLLWLSTPMLTPPPRSHYPATKGSTPGPFHETHNFLPFALSNTHLFSALTRA